MNKKKLIIGLSIVGVFILFILIGVMNKDNMVSSASKFTFSVKTDAVSATKIESVVTTKGTLLPIDSKKIYSKTMTPIHTLHVKAGELVKEGDLLVTFDDLEYEGLVNQLEQAEKSLAMQNNATDSSKKQNAEAIDRGKQTMDQFKIVMDQTQRNLDKALADLKKNQALYEVGGISKEQMNTLGEQIQSLKEKLALDTTAYTNARQSYNNLVSTNNTSTELQRDIQSLQTNQLATKVDDYSLELTSPIAGTILNVYGEEGATLTQASPIIEVADLTNFVVETYISEFNAPSLQLGQSVIVKTRGAKPITFHGEVTFIAPNAEVAQASGSNSKTVRIEVTLTDYDGKSLRPGYTVDSTVTLATKEDAVAIPILSSMKDKDTGEYFVYIVKEDNTLEKRFVTLGIVSDLNVEVEGIEIGETLVVQPNSRLEEGMEVTSVPMVSEEESEEAND